MPPHDGRREGAVLLEPPAETATPVMTPVPPVAAEPSPV